MGGLLFDAVDLAAPFLLAAGFQVANAVLYWTLFSRRPPRPRDPDGRPTPRGGGLERPS